MGCGIKPNSVLGANKHIKFYQGNAIAIDGPNIVNKLLLENLRIPYTQLLRSRIILKPGQTNYLLNHLGLGDNATFVGIVSTFDRNTIEEDNYVQYSYFSDMNKLYAFSHVLFLTGNSINRVEQLYLTNPNPDYPVALDILVAIIDDEASFFESISGGNSAITFTNLLYSYIKTWVIGQTIAIENASGINQIYINIADINTINRYGKIIIIDDESYGSIYLDFVDEFNAVQAMAILSYILSNPTADISILNLPDLTAPIIHFTDEVYINISPYPSGPYTSDDGDGEFVYLPELILTDFIGDVITKSDLLALIIETVIDDLDGQINIDDNNIIIYDAIDAIYNEITVPASYYIKFNISDIAQNAVSEDVVVLVNVL